MNKLAGNQEARPIPNTTPLWLSTVSQFPTPKRPEMGQGDADAATVEDLGTVTVRRDPQGARGSRAAR
jgi:hypothetical protein